jgi:Tfp pilus assembly protein PilN
MMRINLLPPEILEKRKSERRLVYVALVAVLVLVILAGVWGVAFMRVNAKKQEVAARQQELAQTQARAAELKVFEDKSLELQRRKAVADTALMGRRNWARLFDEISLVMPTDVWATTLNATEGQGLQIDGYAIDSASDSPDLGHKSIAKLLVRLANLDQLFDVWLTNASKVELETSPVIQFTVTASVSQSTTASSDAGNQ